LVALSAIPIVLSSLILGAHFLRVGNTGLTAVCLIAPLLLFYRRAWVPLVARTLLIASSIVWVQVARELISIRMALGESWIRMALILGTVALFTAASSLTFGTKSMKRWYRAEMNWRIPSAAAFLLTCTSLAIVQIKVANPMILLERFWPGGGWVEILGLSVYAAWLTPKVLDSKNSGLWRKRIWLAFSVVFFAQLALGLAGNQFFLMTGTLHIPVPALIVAGPIFRGEGFFMPILFGATLLLVGPAWCSHLCYVGAWDHAASLSRRRPTPLPSWTGIVRIAILSLVVVTALALGFAGASVMLAGGAGLAFGLIGVIAMITWSRKTGVMTHCTVLCPMGLIANIGGRLSPFRIRIKDGCDDCCKCTMACKFDALNKDDIRNRCPGLTCTLCGDCLSRCKDSHLEYQFAGRGGPGVRVTFLVLVIALHAVFMGLARM
jgi:4Fe-4S binding protein